MVVTFVRIDDRMIDQDKRFESIILPKYMRRTPSIDSLIPLLYLKGISTNDFPSALSALILADQARSRTKQQGNNRCLSAPYGKTLHQEQI